jgi:hypothetical protein
MKKSIAGSLLLLAVLLSACGAQSQGARPGVAEANQKAYVIDSLLGRVGDIHLGMSESELIALGYPAVRKPVVLEGDSYVEIDVKISERAALACLFDSSGSLYRFSTTSVAVRDEHGSGVGIMLRDLKQRNPAGKVLIGDEDGRYANFITGSKVIFQLDQNRIGDTCFDASAQGCDIDDQTAVTKLVVDRYAN